MSIANVGCTHRHHLDVELVGAAGSEDLLLHPHQVRLGNNINITITVSTLRDLWMLDSDHFQCSIK